MAFGSFDRKSSSQPMAEINMVPLIDVVLVLLVIFIVTAPLLTNVVKLDLPKATVQRSLNALADAGWLVQDLLDPGRWTVSARRSAFPP